MRASVVIVLVALAARVAAAAPADPPEEEKSEALGVTLSLLGTITPLALVSVAVNERSHDAQDAVLGLAAVTFVLGPTTGHWYAGRAWTGATSLRLVGAGVSTLAITAAATSDGNSSAAAMMFVLGFGVALGAAIYDTATAARSVDRWNHAHVPSMQPTALYLHGGGYGLGLAGTF